MNQTFCVSRHDPWEMWTFNFIFALLFWPLNLYLLIDFNHKTGICGISSFFFSFFLFIPFHWSNEAKRLLQLQVCILCLQSIYFVYFITFHWYNFRIVDAILRFAWVSVFRMLKSRKDYCINSIDTLAKYTERRWGAKEWKSWTRET